MRFLISLIACLSCALSLASTASAQNTKQAAEPSIFQHQGLEGDASRYETYLKKNWPLGDESSNALLVKGEQSLKQDPRQASRHFASAVIHAPKNAKGWIGLAQSLLAITPDPNNGSERYELPVNASATAYRAYQFAKDDRTQARALRVLGKALERRAYWRPAIDALKISLALFEEPATRKTYQRLRNAHGFRMIDYKADSEASPPRLCLQFSEDVASGPADLAKFIKVDGKDPQSVRAEGRQLCIEGLSHGERYEVQARSGLPAKIGEKLLKTAAIAVYLPDRKPSVRFNGRNYVLPSHGQQGIPVVSVNTQKVGIDVYRIGDRGLAQALQNGDLHRQLSSWDISALKDRSGQHVYKGTMDVALKLNKEVTTAFPVSDAVGTLKPGVYILVAQPKGAKTAQNSGPATQWFIVSDLGLTAFSGRDGVHIFVRSLASTTAISNATVRLVARNNEILSEAKTDANGYVKFDGGLAQGEGGLQPAMLVAEDKTGGYAFLDLTTSAFDLSDRGVKGRSAPGPIDGFLYTERGVYRPGEDVHLTALVRDAKANASSLPVTLIVTRPDGVEHQRTILKDEGLGGRSFRLPLSQTAMTGTWRVRLYTDPKAAAVTNVSFLVEDFVPERLDLTLDAKSDVFNLRENLLVNATGRFLYGPPAAGLAIEGDIIVKPSRNGLKGYKGYQFGLANEYITPVRDTIAGLPSTGADGKAKLSVKLPAIPKTAKPLQADILVRLRESGGRTIERRISRPVATGQRRIGIKPLFKSGTVAEGEKAAFDIVHLDANNKQTDMAGLIWTLYRLDTNWQWYSQNGSWSYEAQTITRKVATGKIDTDASQGTRLTAPVSYGRYQLEITAPGRNALATTLQFNAGWYVSGDAADSPEILDVALDQKTYKAGETAKLRIASKRGGKALISVLGDQLLTTKEVDVKAGAHEVDIEVKEDWGAGAYITAILYRSIDKVAKRMPSRALGIAWLSLDATPRTLGVEMNVSSKLRATETLKVPVKISGLEPGEDARVTISAVDLGILNLTQFKTPAPEKWFYGQRQLTHEIRDFYGRLIDGMRAERGALRSGGDGGTGIQMQGSPPLDETVALHSGLVEVNADGTAEVEFTLPNFNGTVRISAVAWSENKIGHGQHDITIRDPVVLTASAPRILTLGDKAQLSLDLHNVEGPDAKYNLIVNSQANNQTLETLLENKVKLADGERKTERVMITPGSLGLHTFAMRVTGPEGIDVMRQVSINVQPPANDIKRTTISQLDPGQSLTLSRDIAQDLISGRTSINVAVGRHARIDVPSLVTLLDRYPYGCAEQTISKTLPLLYADALAAKVGKYSKKDIEKRIQGAIRHVFSMQDSSGAFGAWGPSTTNIWLTSYVADFLTRAKQQGYEVPERGFNQTLDRLANFIAYAQDFDRGGENRAYALYVLARNARAPIGELRYYADTKLSRFSTPLAKAQLGAALAMMGDKDRSEKAFSSAISDLTQPTAVSQATFSRSDYGSRLRDGAALVALTTEAGVAIEETPTLTNVIVQAAQQRNYTSTQEQAWMLLAANALNKGNAAVSLNFGGDDHTGALAKSLTMGDLNARDIVIKNTGESAVDAVISVVGAAVTPEPAISKGFEIARSYYSLDGEAVDLANGKPVTQNQRLVAVVTVKADSRTGRLLLVDRLPSGFEIENPRLVGSGDVKSLSWIKTMAQPVHTEFRDDRFVAAYDLHASNVANANQAMTLQVAYIVRAVTPGEFVHPAATIEDMYAPERYARTDMNKVTVSAQN